MPSPARHAEGAAARRSPKLVIFATVTLDLIGFGIIIPLLPLYAQELGASGVGVGVLFASYSLMQFVCAPLWGRLSDRVGRKPVLLVSIGVSVAALTVFALAQSYWWLLAARLVAGAGTANISVATAYIADITRPEERARGMGLIGAAFGLGFLIGPAIGGELGRFGFAAPGLFAAGLGLVNLLLASTLLPESLPPERRGASQTASWLGRFATLGGNRALAHIVGLVFVQVASFSMLEVSLVLFVHARFGFGVEASGRLFVFLGAIMVVVQGGLVGPLSRRFGERLLAPVGLFAMAGGMLAIGLTPGGALTALLVALAAVSVGSGLATPSLQSLVSRSSRIDEQGAVLGLSQSASALARVVGPALAGVLIDQSVAMPFLVGSAVMLAGFVGALWLVGRLPSLSMTE